MRRKKQLLERRREMFNRLAENLKPIMAEHPKTALYILELWKYIADVHREGFGVEVEK